MQLYVYVLLFILFSCTYCQQCENVKWNPMLDKRHIAAVILARGGSKGIPLKNLALIDGQSLLTRSLSVIYEIKQFNSIWVSTDHELIAKEAKKFGVKIHWRKPETATDEATSIFAIQEFINSHPEVDIVALIQCTSPFIKKEFLFQALNAIYHGNECAFSVTHSFKLRWTEDKLDQIKAINFNPQKRPRRQDWPGEYVENGMFYFAIRKLITKGLFQSNKVALYLQLIMFVGSIPSYYREIYEICSPNGEAVHRDAFQALLSQSKLSGPVLRIIWDMTGPPQGLITRTNFYKTLALLAWSQQGKNPSDKLFDNFNGKEYPTPDLGDLSSVKAVQARLTLKNNPACLGLTYADIVQLDAITIDLVPEKKGIFLKHSEYLVSSKRFMSTVTRRYNDFVALNELLVARFPYRMIPSLPPKKIVSDSHFLESRRRGLHRWLTLVARHPVICHDALVAYFLTDQRGPDLQYRIRELFRRAPDEFTTSELAATAKDLVPMETGSEFASSREHVRSLVHIVGRLKQLSDAGVERTQAYARDMLALGNQLKALGNEQSTYPRIESWHEMKKGFSAVANEFNSLSTQAIRHSTIEELTVCDRLALLLDVLVSHRDLCERLERGLANDHQQALAKMLSLKKRKIQGVMRGTDYESVEHLETRMLAQENVISNMEMRSGFSLYCVHMETQLVHLHLEVLASVLNTMVNVQIRSHTELSDIWKQIQPIVEKFVPSSGQETVNGTGSR